VVDRIDEVAKILMDLDFPPEKNDPRRSMEEVIDGYRIRARTLALNGLLAEPPSEDESNTYLFLRQDGSFWILTASTLEDARDTYRKQQPGRDTGLIFKPVGTWSRSKGWNGV
jgi:hypothetical protein